MAATRPALSGELGTAGLTAVAYVSGTFTRNFTASFGVGSANSANIRSISFGPYEQFGAGYVSAYRVLLNAAETKDSNHRLDLTLTFNWGRVLTN